MKDQEIDQIFRESLAEFQVNPNENAWDEIASQLKSKKREINLWIPSIAASFVLFALATLFWSKKVDQPLQLEANLIYLERPVQKQITWSPLAADSEGKVDLNTTAQPVLINTFKPNEIAEENVNRPEDTQIALVGLVRKGFEMADWDYVPVNITPLKSKQQHTTNTIKIKYIAGATLDTEAASKNKIGKLIAYAQQTTPADWMGNLRDAKDDLIKSTMTLNY